VTLTFEYVEALGNALFEHFFDKNFDTAPTLIVQYYTVEKASFFKPKKITSDIFSSSII
jgi:hypothetical protein